MTRHSHSPLARSIRRSRTFVATLIVGGIALALVMGGANAIASRAVSISVDDPAPAITVDTLRLDLLSGYVTTRRFIGQVEAPQAVPLGFEQGGTLIEITVDEGDPVSTGQVLARLDTRALMAERNAQLAALDALRAQAELARLTRGRQEQLEKRGFSATAAFDRARLAEAELTARIAQIEAGITGIDVALDKAVLRAPFSGVIGTRFVDAGATMGAGQPVASLLERARPLMRLGLPVDLAQALPPGTRLVADVGGRQYPATVTARRPDLDPATRTQDLIVMLDTSPEMPPPFGQTGHISVDRHVAIPGVWVPMTALQEGARGLWTILVIDPEHQTVQREAVEVLHAEGDRAYVRGTFRAGALAIRSGPHRIVPGQPVLIAGN